MTIRLEFDSIEELYAFLSYAQPSVRELERIIKSMGADEDAQHFEFAGLLTRIEYLETRQQSESHQQCGCNPPNDRTYDFDDFDLAKQIDYARGQIGRNAMHCGIDVITPSDILVIRHVVDNWVEYALVMLKKDVSGVSIYNIHMQGDATQTPHQSARMGDVAWEQPIISISRTVIAECTTSIESIMRNDLVFLLIDAGKPISIKRIKGIDAINAELECINFGACDGTKSKEGPA